MEPVDRTWLCCVVFCDVVSFTRHHMRAQMEIKDCLDTQIRGQLENLRPEDYILLDRGDGAAVCFLMDPETALFFALNLREAVRTRRKCSFPYEIRAGINLGPVKIIRDVNGDKTTLGEGINSAARVMNFADAGQIFVSRSFYEVIGCLSEEYAALFSYLGRRADKHVREYEVYEVAPTRKHEDSPEAAGAEAAPGAAAKEWDAKALQARVNKLAEEIGPMAKILVQRASHKAGTLEELDRLLSASGVRVEPERIDTRLPDTAFDPAFISKAERLLGAYLGPIAAVLVKRAAVRSSDQAALARLLAAELADDDERKGFLASLDVQP